MMTTFSGLELRELPMALSFVHRKHDELLHNCGLDTVTGDYTVGFFDADDRLLATASLDGDTIKGVAVSPDVRNSALLPALLTSILQHASAIGIENPKVFTKPEYAPFFTGLAFTEVGRSSKAVMLEHSPSALSSYTAYLRSFPRNGRVGCIVMHANPLTKGHLYLIDRAMEKCDTLFIIPVAENGLSEFSYSERLSMLRDATSGREHVTVVEGSHYAVSRSSFPSYFIKELTTRTDAHIELDLDIFIHHIAPALDVDVRFVGSEPLDMFTARYNEIMHRALPEHGIAVEEIPRLEEGGEAVSASRVRKLLDARRAGMALPLLSPQAVPYFLAHAAATALRDELDTTPKPGLVDREDSGSHTDMDYALMSASIKAITPVFSRLASLAREHEIPSVDDMRQIGLEGEHLMLEATSGVNTHRGALFSLGLLTVAASSLWFSGQQLGKKSLQERIIALASHFPRPEGTHGSEVGRRYRVPTALDSALAGYPDAFSVTPSTEGNQKSLLRLMAVIDDSNIYHRCGPDTAAEVKRAAAELLSDYSDTAMRQLNKYFISRRISPGGSADMLAFALLADSLSANTNA